MNEQTCMDCGIPHRPWMTCEKAIEAEVRSQEEPEHAAPTP